MGASLQAKPFAEIDPAHVLVGHDLVRAALHQHLAVMHDVGAIDDLQRLPDVVVGDQDADAARFEVADDALDLDHRDRIDTGEWFVEQDEARLGGQRTRDRHAALLADGQAAGRPFGETLEADLLLVAVGRGPVTEGLGYGEVGVAMERGFITTDARLRTSVPGVYAVGDIVPGLQLAHRGFAQGIFVAEDIAGLDPAPIDETGIPRVTYCDPEIASVGLTEEQAREKYADVETYEYNLGGNGKSQILQTAGFVKLVREKDGPVVGVHMVGARMGEQIGEAQLIVGWEGFPSDVASLVHAHPTQNEALGEAHLALAGKPLHAHA